MKLNVALVGAGGMGKAWARNLIENSQTTIAAWVDIRPDAAAESASELRQEIPYCGTDLDAVLNMPEIDFVVDVTIPESHCEVTLKALAAGKPVLGEKPMASNLEDAAKMVEASEKSKKLYMVSQSRRYHPAMRAIQQAVENEFDSISIINADFYIGAHFGGFRDEMASPLLLDMAIHTFDQARALTGLDPVSVYAEEFNPGWSWYQGGACANALFEMANGARFCYRGSWCAEGLSTSWDSEWRIVGKERTLSWDGFDDVQIAAVKSSEGFIRETSTRHLELIDGEDGIAGSLSEFIHALETGTVPSGECHDNIKSLAMVFAAVESAQKGVRVPVRTGF